MVGQGAGRFPGDFWRADLVAVAMLVPTRKLPVLVRMPLSEVRVNRLRGEEN
jgi:hypothetical protein